LFADVLRRYLASLPDGRTGWLAGARDPAVSRALGAIHRNPAQAWTLDGLAKEAGISRSALTERFAKYLGVAPMSYLTDWRLELGAEALRTSNHSVQSIAMDAGYESEAAFNRAFKRRFEKPPARYRREWRERPKHRAPRTARRA
jgi:transcriptional regulator GlxA family with amidase domain